MNISSPFAGLPPVVRNLLVINIICFVGSLIFEQSTRFFGVFYPDSPFFRIWQVVTYMFMHGSMSHIFFNMFSLYMFGPIIEQILGAKRFLNLYFIAGIGALILQFGVQAFEVQQIVGSVAAHEWLNFDMLNGTVSSNFPNLTQADFNTLISIYNTPLVGASGAIYGLLLAFAYLFPNMKLQLLFIPVPIAAKFFIPIMILIEIYMGFSDHSSSIAHLAHVGGALFGYIMLKIWRIRKGIY